MEALTSAFPPRCIKPNESQAPGLFTDELVRNQVRYLGLLENVRVRRAGYAYRQPYQPCLERYRLLSTHTWPRWAGTARYGAWGGQGTGDLELSGGHPAPTGLLQAWGPWKSSGGGQDLNPMPGRRDGVQALFSDLDILPEELAYGHTKVFIRTPRTVSPGGSGWGQWGAVGSGTEKGGCCAPPIPDPPFAPPQLFDLEERRRRQVEELATLIQKTYRGWRCRTQYQLMRKSQILISAWFRGHVVSTPHPPLLSAPRAGGRPTWGWCGS